MIGELAKMLGLNTEQAVDSMKSNRCAKHILSRRSFAGLAGLLVTGVVTAQYKKHDWLPWNDPSNVYVELSQKGGLGYNRVSVARTAENWRVSGDEFSSQKAISFPTSGPGTPIQYLDTVTIYSASGHVVCSGELSKVIPITRPGITPFLISIKGKFDSRFPMHGVFHGKATQSHSGSDPEKRSVPLS